MKSIGKGNLYIRNSTTVWEVVGSHYCVNWFAWCLFIFVCKLPFFLFCVKSQAPPPLRRCSWFGAVGRAKSWTSCIAILRILHVLRASVLLMGCSSALKQCYIAALKQRRRKQRSSQCRIAWRLVSLAGMPDLLYSDRYRCWGRVHESGYRVDSHLVWERDLHS